ncbi:MAG: DUF975 family protein [Ruminococcus sp.]
MNPEKTIRQQAKETLKHNWLAAVGVTITAVSVFVGLIYLASAAELIVDSLVNYISNAAKDLISSLGDSFDIAYEEEVSISVELFGGIILGGVILLSPLVTGMVRYFYILCKNGEARYSELFYYFSKKYFRTVGFNFMISLRCFWRFLVSVGPGVIALNIMMYYTYDAEALAFWQILCYLLIYALIFGGVILFAKLSTKYFLCYYLMFEDENIPMSVMFSRAKELSEPLKDRIFKLFLSISPWLLLSILVYPLLFIVPYALTCMSTSAKWILALQENTVAEKVQADSEVLADCCSAETAALREELAKVQTEETYHEAASVPDNKDE